MSVSCGECKRSVEEEAQCMQCEACHAWFHLSPCCNITQAQYDVLFSDAHGLKNVVRWFCSKCDSNILKCMGDLTAVKQRLDALENNNNNLEALVERKVKLYFSEKEEIEKRRNNVVLFSIPEPHQEVEDAEGEMSQTTPAERKRHDIDKVCALGETDVKLAVQPKEVSSVFRIGVKRNDGKPRMVCVKLDKTEVRDRLLRHAKSLRNSANGWQKNMYINPDLTKEQRQHSDAARKELFRRKGNGETDLVICNFQVVKRMQSANQNRTQ